MEFLGNLRGVLAAGFLLSALLAELYAALVGFDGAVFALFALRWLHVLCGAVWIGLLWYFNVAQMPAFPELAGEKRQAITGHIAPCALFWMRWSAMGALLFGILLAWREQYLGAAMTLDVSQGLAGWPVMPKYLGIGIGMWLGIIMWFNAWFLVWPGQQKALNIGGRFPDLGEAERAEAERVSRVFTRINLLLSIPMLFSMVAAGHLY